MNITNILDVDELIRFYNGELGIVLCVLYSVLFVRGKWLDNVENFEVERVKPILACTIHCKDDLK